MVRLELRTDPEHRYDPQSGIPRLPVAIPRPASASTAIAIGRSVARVSMRVLRPTLPIDLNWQTKAYRLSAFGGLRTFDAFEVRHYFALGSAGCFLRLVLHTSSGAFEKSDVSKSCLPASHLLHTGFIPAVRPPSQYSIDRLFHTWHIAGHGLGCRVHRRVRGLVGRPLGNGAGRD